MKIPWQSFDWCNDSVTKGSNEEDGSFTKEGTQRRLKGATNILVIPTAFMKFYTRLCFQIKIYKDISHLQSWLQSPGAANDVINTRLDINPVSIIEMETLLQL